MDYIDQNIFPLFLLFIGVMLIISAMTSFQQKGISTISSIKRFQGILITIFITVGILWYTSFNDKLEFNSLFITLSPLIAPLAVAIMQRKKDEIHIKKYVPQDVFNVLERNLSNKGISYHSDVIADDEFISSNYISIYYLNESDQTIRIKWKDLGLSGLVVEFNHFEDKDFIKEVVADLRKESPPISFFGFNKISLSFAVIAIYIGAMQLLGF